MRRMDNTLADLLPDILCRMPVKSLMQFNCVEKTWRSLIEDNKFIIKHLTFFNGDEDACLQSYDLVVKSSRSTKSFVSVLSHKQNKSVALDLLDLPYNKYMFVHLQVLGPCNGIYYIHGFPSSLINPSMREFKILPDMDVPPPLGTQFVLTFPGFGFDPNTDDYKVVLLKLPSEQTPESTWKSELYSFNTNRWREVECPIPSSVSIHGSEMNSFVNGAYHWWGHDSNESFVIAFDMFDEMFKRIKFPIMSDSTLKTADVSVACFKNSLTVMLYPPSETTKHFDMWVLKDYSNESSWVKQLRIQPSMEVERPIGFSRRWDQLVLESKKGQVILFDLKNSELKELGICGERRSLQVLAYEESLVSLKRRSRQHQHQTEVAGFNVVADPHHLGN